MSDFDDLPSSRLFVYTILDQQEPLTVTQLQDRTNMSRRTVHRAIDDLRDLDRIESYTDPENARKTLYETA